MPKKKNPSKILRIKHQRCRRLKIINLAISFLVIINLSGYFFFCGPDISVSRAAGIGFSLRIIGDEITPVPEVVVTPTIIPGGGILNPENIKIDILTPGEDNLSPYIKILKIDEKSLDELSGLPQIINNQPTFSGKTNIKNAILFIELGSLGGKIFTTYATNQGLWSWQTPVLLGQGNQTINITAFSPADTKIRASFFLSFEIISGEKLIPPYLPSQPQPVPPLPIQPPEIIPGPSEIPTPTQPTTTTPPIIPGQSQPPAGQPSAPAQPQLTTPPGQPPQPPPLEERIKNFISLNLQVLNKDKKIYPREKISTKTEILNLSKIPQRINLKYEVISPQGEVINTSYIGVDLVNNPSVLKDYQTSFMIKTGLYTIRVETELDGIIFQSQDQFEIIEKPVVALPGGVVVNARQASEGLLAVSLILLIMLIYFLILLREEYKRSLSLPPINERDFWKNKSIS